VARGAARVGFVAIGRVGQRLIRENIAICGVEACARLVGRDARRLGASEEAFDLVFLDPPYGKGLGEAALNASISGGWIAPGALIVWEEGGAVTVPDGLSLLDERAYGDTVIRVLEAG